MPALLRLLTALLRIVDGYDWLLILTQPFHEAHKDQLVMVGINNNEQSSVSNPLVGESSHK
jgi:hypothetical protein